MVWLELILKSLLSVKSLILLLKSSQGSFEALLMTVLSADHEREEDGTISSFTLTLLRCTAQPSHTQDTVVRVLRLYNWPPLSRYLARYLHRYLDI